MRTLLLDLDGTLMNHRAAADSAVVAWAGALLDQVPDGLAARWAALEEHHVGRAERGEVDWREQRRHRLRDLFTEVGHPPVEADGVLDAHFADFLAHYEQAWTPYDDVVRAVGSWQEAGVRLGMVTNGIHAQQRRKLAALGISDAIGCLVALDDVGVGKPDPRIFRTACDELGVAPADAVYVGDDVVRDAIGASAAGLTGVWLDRFGLPVPDGVDLVVHSLDEVLALL